MRIVSLRFADADPDISSALDAYYTQDSLESLHTIDDIPVLSRIEVPRNRYVCARNNGARRNARHIGASEHMLPPLVYHDALTSSSSSSTDDDSPTYPIPPLPPVPLSPSHAPIPPVAPLPPGYTLTDRRLAPLEYLQNCSPKARDPADDEALRQFQYTMSPL